MLPRASMPAAMRDATASPPDAQFFEDAPRAGHFALLFVLLSSFDSLGPAAPGAFHSLVRDPWPKKSFCYFRRSTIK